MKAAANGVLNLSIADGWWPEAADGKNGWTIGGSRVYGNQELQNEADATALYRLLEEEVVPTYFGRDARDVPMGWVEMMKHCLRHRAGHLQHRPHGVGLSCGPAYSPLAQSYFVEQSEKKTPARARAREFNRVRQGLPKGCASPLRRLSTCTTSRSASTSRYISRSTSANCSRHDVVAELVVSRGEGGEETTVVPLAHQGAVAGGGHCFDGSYRVERAPATISTACACASPGTAVTTRRCAASCSGHRSDPRSCRGAANAASGVGPGETGDELLARSTGGRVVAAGRAAATHPLRCAARRAAIAPAAGRPGAGPSASSCAALRRAPLPARCPSRPAACRAAPSSRASVCRRTTRRRPACRRNSGISMPPTSFIMLSIGGSDRPRFCRKPDVALPFCPVPDDDLVELDVLRSPWPPSPTASPCARASAAGTPPGRRRSPRRCARDPPPSWRGSRTHREPSPRGARTPRSLHLRRRCAPAGLAPRRRRCPWPSRPWPPPRVRRASPARACWPAPLPRGPRPGTAPSSTAASASRLLGLTGLVGLGLLDLQLCVGVGDLAPSTRSRR